MIPVANGLEEVERAAEVLAGNLHHDLHQAFGVGAGCWDEGFHDDDEQ